MSIDTSISAFSIAMKCQKEAGLWLSISMFDGDVEGKPFISSFRHGAYEKAIDWAVHANLMLQIYMNSEG